MAQKRMFDKGLLETDAFMDMPMPTKALYFLLGMEADDEGFVSPTRVMRIYGGNADDLKVLIAKNFVIQFESGVIVITDWHENNWLDTRRIKETKYKNEKKLLALTSNKYRMLNNGLATAKQPLSQSSIEESRVEEGRIVESSISSELSSQVKKVMDIFYEINPTINWGNKTTRKACEDLIKRFGLDGTLGMARAVVSLHGVPYAPQATTPYEMKEKLAKFKGYFESEKRKQESNKFTNVPSI